MPRPTATHLFKDLEKDLVELDKKVIGLEFKVTEIDKDLVKIEEKVKEIRTELIPPSEWTLIKKIVFGAVGIVLVGLLTTLLSQVLK